MTDHQKFNQLLKELGMSRHDLANHIGLTKKSIYSQLAPSKGLPKWAKSMLLVYDRIGNNDKIQKIKEIIN